MKKLTLITGVLLAFFATTLASRHIPGKTRNTQEYRSRIRRNIELSDVVNLRPYVRPPHAYQPLKFRGPELTYLRVPRDINQRPESGILSEKWTSWNPEKDVGSVERTARSVVLPELKFGSKKPNVPNGSTPFFGGHRYVRSLDLPGFGPERPSVPEPYNPFRPRPEYPRVPGPVYGRTVREAGINE